MAKKFASPSPSPPPDLRDNVINWPDGSTKKIKLAKLHSGDLLHVAVEHPSSLPGSAMRVQNPVENYLDSSR